MLINVQNLTLTYQARVLNERRSWLRQIVHPEYRNIEVLKSLNFYLTSPGVTAVLGRNGAGKTTLIKVLTGILEPTSGNIEALGFVPSERDPQYLKQIGAVFGQKKMLWTELSLRENFRLTAAVYQIKKKEMIARADWLIEYFKMADLSDRPIKSLSLGESMKAEVANVLLFEPQLLFLDEPTIGLDFVSANDMRLAIAQYVKRSQCHVILTSHNVTDIVALADQVYFMENGKLHPFSVSADRNEFQQLLEQKLLAP